MKFLILLSSALMIHPAFSDTQQLDGAVFVSGNCFIGTEGVKTFDVTSDKIEKSVLGYVGIDGARYKITIANNGSLPSSGSLEDESGALQIGFSRDEPTLQSPPELCPTRPERLKKECEDRNAANHPPFTPASDLAFEKKLNDNGEADAEMNDDFEFLKVVVSGKKIQNGIVTFIQTPVFNLGGIESFCAITATRK